MRENVAFRMSLQRAGGWCEPVTVGMEKSLLNSKAETIRSKLRRYLLCEECSRYPAKVV